MDRPASSYAPDLSAKVAEVLPGHGPGLDAGTDPLGDDGELEVGERLVEPEPGQVATGSFGVVLDEFGPVAGNPPSR